MKNVPKHGNRKYGFISFLDDSYSDGDISQEKWNEIFLDISGKTNKEIQDYLSSKKFKGWRAYFNSFRSNKADVFSFLKISDEDTILDIGCGSGSWTVPLSKLCKEVYALDSVLNKLRFLDIRDKNDGLDNIITIHANTTHMPFREPCFDYVLMRDVPGDREENTDPQDLQKKRLKTIAGLLKEGGQVVAAIENRHAFNGKLYLAGFLASKLGILRRKQYRGYSFNDHRKMFEEAGFRDVDVYYIWPDAHDPKYIFSQKDRNVFQYYLEHFVKHTVSALEYMFFRRAYQLGLEQRFVLSFVIVGKK